MQFTDIELKMIRRLRLQHETWRSTRLIILVGSVVALMVSFWQVVRGQPDTATGILFCLSAGGFSHCLGGWSGRPEIVILLKLAEAQQSNAQAQQTIPADRPKTGSG